MLFSLIVFKIKSPVLRLNGERFNFHIYLNKEKNYVHLILDKPNKGDNFKFFNINHEDNITMSEIIH